MNSLKEINLKNNPFSDTTPSRDRTNYFWAGMESVKDRINSCYEAILHSPTKQLVLNWGPYGGGKTFSAYYFINSYKNTDNIHQIYLRSPKDGSKLAREIFNSIIDELTFESISERVKLLEEYVGDQELMRYLTAKSGGEYAKAIILMGSEDESILKLMNRFLYNGSLTASEMKSVELAKPVKTDSDLIKLLTGILSCFAIEHEKIRNRLVIWFDEMEDIIYYSTKHYKAFSQFLRDLFDNVSNNFLIFLNFTLAEGEESTIELILGTAVWTRISKKIRFKDFDHNDAYQYASELLNEAKIDKRGDLPFDDNWLAKILNILPLGNLTPREINKFISSFIHYIQINELMVIDDNDINKFIKETNEDDF